MQEAALQFLKNASPEEKQQMFKALLGASQGGTERPRQSHSAAASAFTKGKESQKRTQAKSNPVLKPDKLDKKALLFLTFVLQVILSKHSCSTMYYNVGHGLTHTQLRAGQWESLASRQHP